MSVPAVLAAAPTAGSRLWIQWTLSNRRQLTIVSFAGEVDLTNDDHLVNSLVAAVDAGTERLILDLSGVEVLDVAVARALFAVQRHMVGHSVRLDVVCAGPMARKLHELTGGDVVGLHASMPEALAFQAGQSAGPQGP